MTATPEGTVRVARDGSRGWHFIDKAKYDADPAAFVVVDTDGKSVPADPLDHDGDGKKGGSKPVDDELKSLRAEYAAKIGKKPYGAWDTAELRKRIDEAGQ